MLSRRPVSDDLDPAGIGRETARYVALLAEDMARITKGVGLEPLNFILSMAAMEASNLAKDAMLDWRT